MALTKPKLVIFDLDETLIQRKAAFCEHVEKLFADRGIAMPDDIHDALQCFSEHDRLDALQEQVKTLARRNSNERVQKIVEEGLPDEFWSKCEQRPCTNAVTVLQELKKQKITVAIVTSRIKMKMMPDDTEKRVKKLGFGEYVDDVVRVGPEIGPGAAVDPDNPYKVEVAKAEAFSELIRKHNFSPQETWSVGDRAHDMEAAMNAGATPVLCSTNPKEIATAKAKCPSLHDDQIFPSLRALLPEIQALSARRRRG